MSRVSKKKVAKIPALVEPLLYIQNLADPIEEDTETDKCVGLRHVEHNLDLQLFPLRKLALQTEIFLYWNNVWPEDFKVVDESNVDDQVYFLTMPKENILPERATTFCTVQEPGEDPVESNWIRTRIKLDRPANPDPAPETPGNQGLVVFLPEDIAAGAVVDPERVALGIILEVQPYAQMAVFDTCRFAWGSASFTRVVKPEEVSRGFEIEVPAQVIYEAGSDPYLPFAMQVYDAVGNFPHFDPESDANWSPVTPINVDLGTRPLEAAFLEQPGDRVDLKQLGDGPQRIKIFLDPKVFTVGDEVRLSWVGQDAYNETIPYSTTKIVERTNSFMTFEVPNERVKALGGGIAVLAYSLNKAGTDNWLASRKTRISVRGAVSPWQAPQVPAAIGGCLDPTLSQATVEIVVPDGWDAPAQVRLVWVGRSITYTQEYTLENIPADRRFVLTIDGAQIQRFNGQSTELYYERTDSSLGRQSLRLPLQVGEPAGPLPKARVEFLNTGHKVMVTLPFTETQPGDTLTLQWIASQSRTTVPIIVDDCTAGHELQIPVSVADLDKGEIVRVYYSLTRCGKPTRYSHLLVWFMGQCW
ncbi:hypothetical protein [Pseudomonas syringae]|uniref:hypothetical protein n=1 Tax=Pseudomonas syringae TaxID=317 RepID=UPI001F2CCA92|nr:hypothetical protein [Pseudomonas syringae]MCF5724159.1 hypothetical protein [Pseudomonas syringae]